MKLTALPKATFRDLCIATGGLSQQENGHQRFIDDRFPTGGQVVRRIQSWLARNLELGMFPSPSSKTPVTTGTIFEPADRATLWNSYFGCHWVRMCGRNVLVTGALGRPFVLFRYEVRGTAATLGRSAIGASKSGDSLWQVFDSGGSGALYQRRRGETLFLLISETGALEGDQAEFTLP